MNATLVDGKALFNVALVSFVLTVAAVAAFGTIVLAGDRISAARETGRGTVAPSVATIAAAALACAAILALGIWAMAQK